MLVPDFCSSRSTKENGLEIADQKKKRNQENEEN
jgi:hypothetical protein